MPTLQNKTKAFYLYFFITSIWAQNLSQPPSIQLDPHNKASLQRGAALFMNYCSGCHSLKYLRYDKMAHDLGIKTPALLKNNLIFTQAEVGDFILTALPPEDAQQWFGLVPPDLSLITRQRGLLWLYGYLRGFYKDTKRPFGVNNILVPNVAMPDVLESLRSSSRLKIHIKQSSTSFANNQNGALAADDFEQVIADLLHFLSYAAEPHQLERRQLAPWVTLFLILLLIPVYLLQKLYWSRTR